MQAATLREVVRGLPARLPVTDEFERSHGEGDWSGRPKQHLDGWLLDYDRPGFYDRQRPGQDARHFYTHFKCAPGLLWLAKGLAENQGRLHLGTEAITAAGSNPARRCGAFRAVVPWERIEELLQARPRPRVSRVVRRLR